LDLTITSLENKMKVKELDKKLVKRSNVRVVKSGQVLEVYEYEREYFYNMGMLKRGDFEIEDTSIKRIDNIERAQRKIKRLVNANAFVFGYWPIFVTYTFAENVQDVAFANKVFKEHMRDLRRRVVGRKLRYVCVPETQKRGAIHFHVVFFDLPYISGIKDVFATSWGQGWVDIKAVKHVRNIGAYVSKYFGKQWLSDRKPATKNYFSSVNLLQPEVFRNLDILRSVCIIETEHEQSFFSLKYGIIKYTQYKIKI